MFNNAGKAKNFSESRRIIEMFNIEVVSIVNIKKYVIY